MPREKVVKKSTKTAKKPKSTPVVKDEVPEAKAAQVAASRAIDSADKKAQAVTKAATQSRQRASAARASSQPRESSTASATGHAKVASAKQARPVASR